MKMNHGDMVQKSTLSKALVVKWKPSKLGVSDDLFSIEGVATLFKPNITVEMFNNGSQVNLTCSSSASPTPSYTVSQ